MFRIDTAPAGAVILTEGDQTIMETGRGKENIPCPTLWVCGAAFLSRCFGVTVQRIYQLRDLGVLTPEDEKDKGTQVFNFARAIRDMIEFKRHGKDGLFSNGYIRGASEDDDPIDYDQVFDWR